MSAHKRGYFPLIAEGELSEAVLRSSLGMTTKGAHSRMRMTLNQLEKEEIALLKSEQLLQLVSTALKPEDASFDALSEVNSRLAQRQQNKEHLRDLAPLMQELLPKLDEQLFAPEKKHLEKLSNVVLDAPEREPLLV